MTTHLALYRWRVHVELRLHPRRGARLRALERDAARAESAEAARQIAAEIAALLDEACREAAAWL